VRRSLLGLRADRAPLCTLGVVLRLSSGRCAAGRTNPPLSTVCADELARADPCLDHSLVSLQRGSAGSQIRLYANLFPMRLSARDTRMFVGRIPLSPDRDCASAPDCWRTSLTPLGAPVTTTTSTSGSPTSTRTSSGTRTTRAALGPPLPRASLTRLAPSAQCVDRLTALVCSALKTLTPTLPRVLQTAFDGLKNVRPTLLPETCWSAS
jgi:hypothetical protein